MTSSADPQEVEKFERMAREWWDPHGKFKPLHKMNPCRLGYITDQIAWHYQRDLRSDQPFKDLTILDIGCGGGLICEPLTRLGAQVVGIDAAPTNIEVASLHAKGQNLDIDYRNILAEDLNGQFDVVLAMEIVEHVAAPEQFLKVISDRLSADGIMIMSTLNRTTKSYLAAILGAEYILRWLPRGTHDWQKFMTPDELFSIASKAGLQVKDRQGMVFHPFDGWKLSRKDLSINYVITAVKG